MMSIGKMLVSAAIVLGLVSGSAPAAEPHKHGDTAAAGKLQLDNGKKWQTDDALRRGMGEIRVAVAEALTPIHKKAFTPAQYAALAARIQTQIDYVVGNCKLPEAADHQLHLVLEQIIDGVAQMTARTGRDKGAVKIVKALGQYGEYFEDPGWRPLVH